MVPCTNVVTLKYFKRKCNPFSLVWIIIQKTSYNYYYYYYYYYYCVKILSSSIGTALHFQCGILQYESHEVNKKTCRSKLKWHGCVFISRLLLLMLSVRFRISFSVQVCYFNKPFSTNRHFISSLPLCIKQPM